MDIRSPNSNAARGRAHVIYPSYDPLSGIEHLVAVKGDGIRVYDEEGRSYIEAVAGLWCASLGFKNERLARAAYNQMQTLPFYHAFAGKTHLPIIDLAEKLISLAPSPMDKVYFANSGSEANDTAIKIVWYYNNARGKPDKKKIIGRVRGYHGITLAAASVTGQALNHRSFDVPLARFYHVMCPDHYHNALPGESEEDFATRCADELENLVLREGPDTVAAMFMEPILGGGGVIVPPRTYSEKMQAVLRRYDVLLVADEVICGFGRTGNYWGSQTVELKPDIVTCAKALSAAFLPISALMISKPIADWVIEEAHKIGAFASGFTYSGHPTCAAVALEALKIYDEIDIVGHVQSVGGALQEGLRARFADHPLIGQVRGAGLMSAIEIVADKKEHANFASERKIGPKMQQICQDNGVIVRASPNDSIAVCPPLIITRDEIGEVIDVLAQSLDTLASGISKGEF